MACRDPHLPPPSPEEARPVTGRRQLEAAEHVTAGDPGHPGPAGHHPPEDGPPPEHVAAGDPRGTDRTGHHPPEGSRARRYATPGALRAALEARLAAHGREAAVDLERLRRRAVFERLLVRLEAAAPGRWVLKGGMALELRLGDRARSTRDLDLALREAAGALAAADGEAVRERLIEALAGDPDGDGFQFRVGPPRAIGTDEAGRPGWRMPVQARLDGRPFASVRLDVVARAEELSATGRVLLPGLLGFAGFPVREVEVVDPAQHFAEKLHALTRDYGERPNSRVRDLADLVLLLEDGLEPSAELAAVASHVFAVRATHPLPEALGDPPPWWAERYAELAADLDIGASTLGAAMGRLREAWEAARRELPASG